MPLASYIYTIYILNIIFFIGNSLRECTLDYDRCQVNWFTRCLLRTTDRNNHSTKPIVYHNSEQVYEPRLEPVTNGY